MEFYRAIPLDENIYRITSTENVFCELLVGADAAMLIDTGYGFGNLREFVRGITEKPLVIVNTHGHVDHTAGNYRFEEDICLSEADMDLCRRHNTEEMRKQSVEQAEHTVDWTTGKEIYGLPEEFERSTYVKGGCGNLKPLAEGTAFSLGNMTVEAIAVPGHTKGSMAFYCREKNWLYVGDAANAFLWLFDGDATDRATYIGTLDKILALNPEKIWGGHAPSFMTAEDIRRFRKTAAEADYEKGVPFQSPLVPDAKDVRVCVADGYTMSDMGKPGFASIVLCKGR